MAIQNTFYLDVDIKRDNYVDEPKVTQNDAVTFVLRMTDDGVDYPLTGVSTYTLASLRPDGQSVLTVGTKTADNEITFELGSTEVSVPGNVKAAIQLYDVDGRVSSIPFTYEVTKDIATGYIPSKEEKTLIELVLGEGPAILAAAEAATIAANDAAANADTKAALANAEAQSANSAAIYATDSGLLAEQKAALADASAVNADTATYNAENATQEAQDATDAINAVLPNVEGLENRGEYNSATNYVKNNLVERNGSAWQALQDTVGNPPPTLPTKSNAYWMLVAQRGVDGMGSVVSVNGEGPDVNGNVVITIPNPDLSGLATKTELQGVDDTLKTLLTDFVSVKAFGHTKDSATIQLALDYAESIGGATVYAPSGVYNISEILKVPSNTRLIGLGNVVLKRSAGINAILINKSDGVTGGYDANKNILLSNIKFDGSSDTISVDFTNVAFGHCKDIVIDGCEFYNCKSHHLLELNACKDSVVSNCIFRGYTGVTEVVQLDFAGSSDAFPWFGPFDDIPCNMITFKKNRFLGVGNSTKAIGNHTFKAGVSTEFVFIEDNYFELFNETIFLQDTSNMRLSGNVFKNCKSGLYHKEQLNDVHDWLIEDNIFYGGYISGDEQRLLYGGQTILTKPFYNIFINRNKIYNCWTHGIAATFGGSVDISNNIINGCGKNAIFLYGGSRVNITNNICTNNNKQSENTRADIVIGGNAQTSTNSVILANNNVETCVVSTNTDAVFVNNNIISGSLTNNSSGGAILKSNIVSGIWTA